MDERQRRMADDFVLSNRILNRCTSNGPIHSNATTASHREAWQILIDNFRSGGISPIMINSKMKEILQVFQRDTENPALPVSTPSSQILSTDFAFETPVPGLGCPGPSSAPLQNIIPESGVQLENLSPVSDPAPPHSNLRYACDSRDHDCNEISPKVTEEMPQTAETRWISLYMQGTRETSNSVNASDYEVEWYKSRIPFTTHLLCILSATTPNREPTRANHLVHSWLQKYVQILNMLEIGTGNPRETGLMSKVIGGRTAHMFPASRFIMNVWTGSFTCFFFFLDVVALILLITTTDSGIQKLSDIYSKDNLTFTKATIFEKLVVCDRCTWIYQKIDGRNHQEFSMGLKALYRSIYTLYIKAIDHFVTTTNFDSLNQFRGPGTLFLKLHIWENTHSLQVEGSVSKLVKKMVRLPFHDYMRPFLDDIVNQERVLQALVDKATDEQLQAQGNYSSLPFPQHRIINLWDAANTTFDNNTSTKNHDELNVMQFFHRHS